MVTALWNKSLNTPVQYSDFRGINVTPVIARCFERTVYHHYSKKVFEENLTVTQYAYRKGCSCTDALIQIQHNYLVALDDKDCIIIMLGLLRWIFQRPLIM